MKHNETLQLTAQSAGALSPREQPFDGKNLLHNQMPHIHYPGEPAGQLPDYATESKRAMKDGSLNNY
ncbi:hypothetical protein NOC27_2441 [Nitrosococcus oceani AFC27]|uniref:Uncharacterized protein n=1 Tax=Nitrosococcus oceani C-27 TaxID=314279 RepID=A0A0E2Z4M8_9GAMM|nr:hypothetical protein [Nitrosococcus oceani]EDZ65761.1 hypothetical protein NOC27_2441 [Nitrosococcus oceani AFC27]KFI20444.1 hypothetical protein IB75_02975 [Nitrosococcus oceani C-27]GEM19899.1 hypothetical protein NONS58_12980 [Nitrosococcus oceani]